jgi:hypothetical protein
LVEGLVERQNSIRINTARSDTTPKEMFACPKQEIHAAPNWKLEHAEKQRKARRQRAA